MRGTPTTEAASRWGASPTTALICAALCLCAGSAATAQSRGFAATPLSPGRTISSSVKRFAESPAAKIIAPDQAGGACEVTIAPGVSPAGYLPLSTFSIPPVSGVGDDTITDFNVPAFTYVGETYTRIGFSSNGYAIVGGSTQTGDNSISNQYFPDANVPNNVLAPFWTDLDPPLGGTLRIGTLTDGTNTWIVLDWNAVKEFSTLNNNSFEIWIGVNSDANPAQDITYAYGTIQGTGDGGFLTVGAENKFGTRGHNTYLNGVGTLPGVGTQLRVSDCNEIFANGFEP